MCSTASTSTRGTSTRRPTWRTCSMTSRRTWCTTCRRSTYTVTPRAGIIRLPRTTSTQRSFRSPPSSTTPPWRTSTLQRSGNSTTVQGPAPRSSMPRRWRSCTGRRGRGTSTRRRWRGSTGGPRAPSTTRPVHSRSSTPGRCRAFMGRAWRVWRGSTAARWRPSTTRPVHSRSSTPGRWSHSTARTETQSCGTRTPSRPSIRRRGLSRCSTRALLKASMTRPRTPRPSIRILSRCSTHHQWMHFTTRRAAMRPSTRIL
mmetsp:Transcript_406/g.1095  ORF Transcript_406/g.1095 Transcript_406/m.1095 type:complete len:258 (+) Transcript_406:1260-2033(+)